MTGEAAMQFQPSGQPGGWTTDTLHSALLGRMIEQSRRYDAEHAAIRQLIQDAVILLNARFDAQKEALGKSEAATEKRFDHVNEFRQSLADQTATLMSRTEATTRLQALADRMVIVEGYARSATERRAIVDTSVARITTLESLTLTLTERVAQTLTNAARIDAIEKIQDQMSGRERGVALSWAILIGAVAVTATVVGLLSRFF